VSGLGGKSKLTTSQIQTQTWRPAARSSLPDQLPAIHANFSATQIAMHATTAKLARTLQASPPDISNHTNNPRAHALERPSLFLPIWCEARFRTRHSEQSGVNFDELGRCMGWERLQGR